MEGSNDDVGNKYLRELQILEKTKSKTCAYDNF